MGINRVKEHIFQHGLQLNSLSKSKSKRGIGSRLTLRGKKNQLQPRDTAFMPVAGTQSFTISRSGVTGKKAVIAEIMTTERDYVKDLSLVKEHFIFKLEDYGLMQKDLKDAIFGNIEELLPLHQDLLQKLEATLQQESPNFGIIFIELAPKLTVYSNYCSSQSSAVETVEKHISQNPNFGLCLEELRGHESVKGLDLKDFLIKPMQRICKYPLLLRELLKETEESDPFYGDISKAFSVIQDTITIINENKRTVDNLMDLIAIQEMIIDKQISLQAKGRYLIAQKEFKRVHLEPNASPAKITIWVFNDLLLLAKKKDKDKYLYKGQLNPNSCVVWDLEAPGGASDKKNGFSIVNTDKRGPLEKIIIYANTPEEKTEWMDHINTAIGSLV